MELYSRGTVTISVEEYDALKKASNERFNYENQLKKEYDDKMLKALCKLENSLKSVLDFCNTDRRLRRSEAVNVVKGALASLFFLKEKQKNEDC